MVKLEKKVDEGNERTQAEIQNIYTELKVNQAEIQATYAETRAVNQWLAVFQDDITRKVQTLFDADLTRQQHLEAHDKKFKKLNLNYSIIQ